METLWVEALPDVYQRLATNIAGFGRQRAVQALALDEAGKVFKFHVANNSGASSSIYEFAKHSDIWPEVVFTHDVRLCSTTLDKVISDTGFPVVPSTALVMDTQGSELLVLQGAPHVLDVVRYIKTEAADFESYHGCTTRAELIDYLKSWRFDLVDEEPFATHPAGGRYFELLFERRMTASERVFEVARSCVMHFFNKQRGG